MIVPTSILAVTKERSSASLRSVDAIRFHKASQSPAPLPANPSLCSLQLALCSAKRSTNPPTRESNMYGRGEIPGSSLQSAYEESGRKCECERFAQQLNLVSFDFRPSFSVADYESSRAHRTQHLCGDGHRSGARRQLLVKAKQQVVFFSFHVQV